MGKFIQTKALNWKMSGRMNGGSHVSVTLEKFITHKAKFLLLFIVV